ncbi:hypothetical protein ERJ75_000927600 [Trypanosoma vivax]|uniref:Transmembrane protein n=1 Tax=Trypanosoma vivax (strain Y486) TaxID=1055687 RepID=G0TVG5_TRYVY|nr:hypothetical protein TRVL_01143 [Trypanosoma vivax]KAH8612069.1 hypothetical protein ERJ75_000927600 [Trypanosoma vivax]CCC47931.1 conserved hypothetical protein [Trypanosoma vivax Y486]
MSLLSVSLKHGRVPGELVLTVHNGSDRDTCGRSLIYSLRCSHYNHFELLWEGVPDGVLSPGEYEAFVVRRVVHGPSSDVVQVKEGTLDTQEALPLLHNHAGCRFAGSLCWDSVSHQLAPCLNRLLVDAGGRDAAVNWHGSSGNANLVQGGRYPHTGDRCGPLPVGSERRDESAKHLATAICCPVPLQHPSSSGVKSSPLSNDRLDKRNTREIFLSNNTSNPETTEVLASGRLNSPVHLPADSVAVCCNLKNESLECVGNPPAVLTTGSGGATNKVYCAESHTTVLFLVYYECLGDGEKCLKSAKAWLSAQREKYMKKCERAKRGIRKRNVGTEKSKANNTPASAVVLQSSSLGEPVRWLKSGIAFSLVSKAAVFGSKPYSHGSSKMFSSSRREGSCAVLPYQLLRGEHEESGASNSCCTCRVLPSSPLSLVTDIFSSENSSSANESSSDRNTFVNHRLTDALRCGDAVENVSMGILLLNDSESVQGEAKCNWSSLRSLGVCSLNGQSCRNSAVLPTVGQSDGMCVMSVPFGRLEPPMHSPVESSATIRSLGGPENITAASAGREAAGEKLAKGTMGLERPSASSLVGRAPLSEKLLWEGVCAGEGCRGVSDPSESRRRLERQSDLFSHRLVSALHCLAIDAAPLAQAVTGYALVVMASCAHVSSELTGNYFGVFHAVSTCLILVTVLCLIFSMASGHNYVDWASDRRYLI